VPRSRPQRDPPPEFFVDRSLGYYLLPDAMRELGLVVHTMRSVYGPGAEETVEDMVWLEQVGRAGWVALTKDDAIRRRPAGAEGAHGARRPCLLPHQREPDRRAATRPLPGEHQPHDPALAPRRPVDLRRPRAAPRPDLAKARQPEAVTAMRPQGAASLQINCGDPTPGW